MTYARGFCVSVVPLVKQEGKQGTVCRRLCAWEYLLFFRAFFVGLLRVRAIASRVLENPEHHGHSSSRIRQLLDFWFGVYSVWLLSFVYGCVFRPSFAGKLRTASLAYVRLQSFFFCEGMQPVGAFN